MQYGIGRGTQQQPQAMPSMGPDDDQIGALLISQAPNVYRRIAYQQMRTFSGSAQLFGNGREALLRLSARLVFKRS